jgi:hypothetical protein
MRAKHKLLAYCATYLAAIWITASIPLASVLYEFGNIPLCGDTSLGWFIATFYGSFFIYPVAIGGLSMAALVLPLATSISLSKSSNAIYLFLGFYVVTTAIVAFLEFHSSPDGLFQIPPDKIVASSTFFEGLRMACSGQTFAGYKDQLPAVIASGRSYTGSVYYVGFVAQALMQNTLFVVFVAFIYYPKEEIVRRAPYLQNTIFFVLGYAVFLGSIWCLFRISYRNDMWKLLAQNNPFGGDYAIIVLYALVLAVFVAYFEFNLEKLAKTIAQIGQFVVFIGGVALVHQDEAGTFFGTRASVMNIVVLSLLLIFISALTLAFLLRPQRPSK